jgi:hypothetical protein
VSVFFPGVKRVLLRLALVLCALAAAAAAAELVVERLDVYGVHYYGDVQQYLRGAIEVPDPAEVAPEGRIFENKPGVHLVLTHFDYRTDERRLRTAAGRTSPAGAMPVLFLGDSVTLAWGVDDADSWPRRVERGGRAPDGRPLEAQNAGHLMYDTTQQASLLRAWGPRLKSELVVLTYNFNDLQPTWDQLVELHPLESAPAAGGQALPPGGGGSDAGENPVAGFFWALRDLWRYKRDLDRLAEADRSTLPPYSYYPKGWPRCEAALDDVQRTCAALGAQLVINDHSFPAVPELPRWCEQHGVPRIATALPEEDQRRYRNSPIDTHLNAQGNKIVAESVLEQLEQLGILRRAD